MVNNQSMRKIAHAACAFLLVFASGNGVADDTEIYFSSGSTSGNTGDPLLPNVLFILDTSGSMTATVPGTSPSQSRIQVLKEAMVEIINNVEDINLGLMRFTNTEGGPVLFPIRYIDALAVDTLGEESPDPSFSNRITTGNDDGEENNSSHAVVLTDATLDIAELQTFTLASCDGDSDGDCDVEYRVANSSADAEEVRSSGAVTLTGTVLDLDKSNDVGVRFATIDVPQGATILSANLDFWVHTDQNDNPDVDIRIQDVDNAAAFLATTDNLSDRVYTTGSDDVEWDDVSDPSANSMVTSPNISTLIQRIVNSSGWNAGQAMVFSLVEEDGSNDEIDWQSRDTANAVTNNRHPRLRITYSAPPVLSGTAAQTTALRFQAVNIPQGVSVTSAKLIVTSQTDDSAASDWNICIEASDNSAALAATASNITGRTTAPTCVTWSVPATVADEPAESPDLSAVLQEVIDRSGWCGGNALTLIISGTGTRRIKSQEQASGEAAELRYAYSGTDTKGCYQASETAQAGTTYDDSEESTSTTDITRDGNTLDLKSGNVVGLRFRDLDIPQGADILTATIRFNAKESDTGTMTSAITGNDVDSAAQFGTTDADISSRTRTSASVTWTQTTSWSQSTNYTTPDISTVVEEIVGRAGWASGNDMVIIFDTSTTTDRRARSYDDDPNKGPYISITYESEGEPAAENTKTVRERLVELVNELPSSDYTPIVETMHEAAKYWRGEAVTYGLERDNDAQGRISHPGSYCEGDVGSADCNGADTSNYPPYGINNPAGCDPTVNPNDSDCSGQVIEGSPVYVSPFSSELTCVQNYQILLTDGAANSLSSTHIENIEDAYLGGSSCRTRNLVVDADCGGTGEPSCNYSSSETCGVDIAEYLFEEDQSTTLANAQNVSTYTVAFNLTDLNATQFLKDMSNYGTGGTTDAFYSATDATDLVNIFSTILTDVKKDPTSFVAPSLATNAFNRLLSRDEVYFGLFTPSLERHWFGNVKKYNICTSSSGVDPSDPDDDCTLGEILDASGGPAVDPVSNKFTETSQSIWSDVIDGQATTRGGAGGEIVDYTLRKFYTDATSAGTAPTSGTALSTVPHQIDTTTWDDTELAHIRTAVCPTPSTTAGSDCETRMLWMLGKIVNLDSDNDASTTTRWSHNDVLHSSPVVITYGGTDSDSDGVIESFFDKLVVGTNEGGLRQINGSTGAEEWVFMPQSRLALQQQLFDNAEAEHPYGMDVTPTIQVKDVDNDGRIEPAGGDFVRVFSAMRRGGNFIYAIDVSGTSQITSASTAIVPKFLWRIQGGSGDFARLGESWSQPRLAKIYVDVSGVPTQKEVLIFGGGYDGGLDDIFGFVADDSNDNSDPNHSGNAIFIADAATGARILSISGDGSGADIEVEGMHYSIPSRITVLDSDGDGVDDRLYVGDTGGQVWRVDLAPDVETSGTARAGSSVVGLFAKLGSAGGANERRFFEPPSVVQVRDTEFSDAANGEFDYVLMGTGWRQHPLDKDVDDRFYALRDEVIGPMTDSDDDNLADDYPADTTSNAPVANTDLIDVTTRVLDVSDTDITTIRESQGWFFDFTSSGNDGEKVLSAPITIAGAVFVTTYLPDAVTNTEACSANIGGGNAYNFNILTSAATIDWDLDGVVDELTDRTLTLGGGIPSDVVPVFTSEGIVGIVGIEGGAAQLGTLSGLPRFRTYWYEEAGM